MNYVHFIAGTVLATGMLFTATVSAEEVTRFTVEQYQAAIEQFGVSAEEAKAAAERAVEAQTRAAQMNENSDDVFAKLVADFRKDPTF